jgi:hypothetical protein
MPASLTPDDRSSDFNDENDKMVRAERAYHQQEIDPDLLRDTQEVALRPHPHGIPCDGQASARLGISRRYSFPGDSSTSS